MYRRFNLKRLQNICHEIECYFRISSGKDSFVTATITIQGGGFYEKEQKKFGNM